MSVKIRMKRLGATKAPFYRIVVADSRRARNGRFIDQLGFYNPISEPRQFRIDADKVKTWIANGAQPSDTVKRLFKEYGVMEKEGIVAEGLPEAHKAKEKIVDFEVSKKPSASSESAEPEVAEKEEAAEEAEANSKDETSSEENEEAVAEEETETPEA